MGEGEERQKNENMRANWSFIGVSSSKGFRLENLVSSQFSISRSYSYRYGGSIGVRLTDKGKTVIS